MWSLIRLFISIGNLRESYEETQQKTECDSLIFIYRTTARNNASDIFEICEISVWFEAERYRFSLRDIAFARVASLSIYGILQISSASQHARAKLYRYFAMRYWRYALRWLQSRDIIFRKSGRIFIRRDSITRRKKTNLEVANVMGILNSWVNSRECALPLEEENHALINYLTWKYT